MGPIGKWQRECYFSRQNAGHILWRQFLSCLTMEEVYKFVEMVSNLSLQLTVVRVFNFVEIFSFVTRGRNNPDTKCIRKRFSQITYTLNTT